MIYHQAISLSLTMSTAAEVFKIKLRTLTIARSTVGDKIIILRLKPNWEDGDLTQNSLETPDTCSVERLSQLKVVSSVLLAQSIGSGTGSGRGIKTPLKDYGMQFCSNVCLPNIDEYPFFHSGVPHGNKHQQAQT